MTTSPPDQNNASPEAQLNDAVEDHRAGRLFEAKEEFSFSENKRNLRPCR